MLALTEKAAEKVREIAKAESLEGQDLVLWYVPQIENDDTPGDEYCWVTTEVVDGELVNQIHPCAFSALFVPASLASTP